MVNLIIKALYGSKETFKVSNRANAEKMAEEFYEYDDVYEKDFRFSPSNYNIGVFYCIYDLYF